MSSPTNGNLNASVREDLNCWFGDETSAEEEGFLRGIAQLRLNGGDNGSHYECLALVENVL